MCDVGKFLGGPFGLPVSCAVLYLALNNRWMNSKEAPSKRGLVVALLGVVQFL